MIHEPLDFKRAVHLVMRHKIIMSCALVIGLLAGGAWAILRPPMVMSQAWVGLATPSRSGVQTQLVIARSGAVLELALQRLHTDMTPDALQSHVDINSVTPAIIVVSAKGSTAVQAKDMANAVAQGYVDYVSHHAPGGPVQAWVWQPARTAAGMNSSSRLVGISLLGGLLGAAFAGLCILAVSRRDRRLRDRDAIADSIGVPVIASIGVQRPSDAAEWRKLLAEYEPGAVDAWRMRKALQYLGLADLSPSNHQASRLNVTVISSSADRRALAVGPQLAVFAASRNIPTALVVGPQQDLGVTATLRAACAVLPPEQLGHLHLVVRDRADAADEPDVLLSVVVAVVDGEAPEATEMIPTTTTVLAVSAGAATAEQLARLAAGAAVSGHDIIGIFVADPDPGDTTTGRLPQVQRPSQQRRPKRMTGTSMGS